MKGVLLRSCALLSIVVFLLSFFGVLDKQSLKAENSIWSSGVQIAEQAIPNPLVNRGNYDCEYATHTSRYISQEKRTPTGQLIINAEVVESAGKTYTDFCGVSSEYGYIAHDLWSPTNALGRVLPVVAPGNYQLVAVPNSNAVIFTTAGPSGGLLMSVDYNLSAIGALDVRTSGTGVNTKRELVWKVHTLSEFLRYSDNTKVAFDTYSFSSNGDYMIAQIRGKGLVKINTRTLELTAITNLTNSSNLFLAISNDGKYATSYRSGTLNIYDLSSCVSSQSAGNWRITGSLENNCGITEIYQQIKAIYPDATNTSRLRFAPNGGSFTIDTGWNTPAGFAWKRLKISATGYTANTEGYLAMGDSFSSGEGDTEGGLWYEEGTDEQGNIETFENRNLCHLSRRSYPYLLALDQGYLSANTASPPDGGLFHSVACSGAVVHNINSKSDRRIISQVGSEEDFSNSQNQYLSSYLGSLGRWQPGRIKQLDVLDASVFGGYANTEKLPEIITIGIAGNDAGFGDTIASCVNFDTCEQALPGSDKATQLAITIASLKPKLVETYKKTKQASPNSRVYVHGYPIFVQGYGGNCGVNVRLDSYETALVEEGVEYMNAVVESAAKEAGVYYVDVTDILKDKNLCSQADDYTMAVNGVTAGNDVQAVPTDVLSLGLCRTRSGCLGKESFHPNQRGHVEYTEAIIIQTDNLTKSMPEPTVTDFPLPDAEFFGASAVAAISKFGVNGSSLAIIAQPKAFLTTTGGGLNIEQTDLLPGSIVTVEIHSTPIVIGQYTVRPDGSAVIAFQLPPDLEPGSHQVHVTGFDVLGNPIDYYETIVVGNSPVDFDGDGIFNIEDPCPVIPQSNIDEDQDSIDDACDVEAAPVIVQDDERDEEAPVRNENTLMPQVLGVGTSHPKQSEISGLVDTGKAVFLSVVIGAIVAVSGLLIIKTRTQGTYRIYRKLTQK